MKRQGVHNDRYTYEELRAFRMEQATIRDEEKVAKEATPRKNASLKLSESNHAA